MKYIVPSSRIVFTDLMVLLVSVLMALNSTMSFSETSREKVLPAADLPKASGAKAIGKTSPHTAFVTIKESAQGKIYFYDKKEVSLWQLMKMVQKAGIPSVVLRGDRRTHFEWEEFCLLTSKLMKAGVKQISYAYQGEGGKRR